VIAVLGGLGAALMWAGSTLSSSRSTRMIGAASVLAWVMTIGLVLTIPLLVVVHPPVPSDASTLGWLAGVAVGNLLGLLLVYSALRIGKVGVVAPLTSTEGALAAVLAVLAGEQLAGATALLLAVIAAGVAVAAMAPEDRPLVGEHKTRAAILALLAAASFAGGLYSTGHVSNTVALPWILLAPRLLGVVVIAVPLALTRRLRLEGAAVPLVLISGVTEIVGVASYTLGARHDLAVAAVLASQFAAFAAVGAYVLFREVLTRRQLYGVTLVIVGVATLAVAKA
jgi:drug/metabolite transporter (DMT)-like permease